MARGITQGVYACVIKGVVTALYVSVDYYDTEMPSQVLSGLVQEYGTPDIVAWSSNSWDSRTVVWAEEGIALDVILMNHEDIGSLTRVSAAVFFPPLAASQYLNEWPFMMLPSLPSDFNNEA